MSVFVCLFGSGGGGDAVAAAAFSIHTALFHDLCFRLFRNARPTMQPESMRFSTI